ncbi:MAG: S-methyl-5'-thioadenosine phosphorylase [Clostridia bacterium]|nr:S-methyl-5'-thioadenosine phosphorylase [Clostridia bacterium]
MNIELAIIGGTGVYDPEMLSDIREENIETEFGNVPVKIGTLPNRVSAAFLPRHGAGHTVPPHLINYRANIKALKLLGVTKIIATGAVGSLDLTYQPGDFVLLDQFIDFTKSRVMTFYGGGGQGVVHVDMTGPYCPEIRELLIIAASKANVSLKSTGVTYICTEGPRFETPAEINMFSQFGGQVVGMTSVPEVILAREAEICYATIGMVTNYAAGISPNPLTHQEVVETMQQTQGRLRELIVAAIAHAHEYKRECSCKSAIAELGKFK